ncbi:MAG: iron-containing alcohol dehydrogenase, partial [Armatimonadetes bacterium]|nr:iron-containing alcohol dehydrogenase [Armatimonadota bacterium]
MVGAPELGVTGYWNPVRITFGPGSLSALPQVFATLPGRRVTLITGQAIMRELG